MAIRNVIRDLIGVDVNRLSYIPYIDSEGNSLAQDEILFLRKDEYEELRDRIASGEEPENIKIGLTVKTPKATCDHEFGFPIVMADENKKNLAGIKVSKKTGEMLPMHAGCCQEERMIMIGPPSAGKTVCILQYTDSRFRNMIVRGLNDVIILDDMNDDNPVKKEYNQFRKNMMKNGILPEPTPEGSKVPAYVYYIQYGTGENTQHRMLRFEDISGEYCKNLDENSWVFNSNHFFLMIDAEDIVDYMDDEDDVEGISRSDDVAQNLINKLKNNISIKSGREYKITVVITKADMLREEEELKEAFDLGNTVKYSKEKGWEKKVHYDAFYKDEFMRRSECIRAYLEYKMPIMCNTLRMYLNLPPENLTFSMIASIGHECRKAADGTSAFDLMEPMFVDEPLLNLLSEMGVYPLAMAEKPSNAQQVPGIMDGVASMGQSFGVGKKKRNDQAPHRKKKREEEMYDETYDEDEDDEDGETDERYTEYAENAADERDTENADDEIYETEAADGSDWFSEEDDQSEIEIEISKRNEGITKKYADFFAQAKNGLAGGFKKIKKEFGDYEDDEDY